MGWGILRLRAHADGRRAAQKAYFQESGVIFVDSVKRLDLQS
jgi:hypothetical protein